MSTHKEHSQTAETQARKRANANGHTHARTFLSPASLSAHTLAHTHSQVLSVHAQHYTLCWSVCPSLSAACPSARPSLGVTAAAAASLHRLPRPLSSPPSSLSYLLFLFSKTPRPPFFPNSLFPFPAPSLHPPRIPHTHLSLPLPINAHRAALQ